MGKILSSAFLLAAVSSLWLQPARASAQVALVEEVFPGFASAPSAQFVELQAYESGQNNMMGQSILIYDHTGGAPRQFGFFTNPSNGADQATFLFATAQAETLFGITADVQMDEAVIDSVGGKICFTNNGSNDCVSWGAFGGDNTGSGNPFRPAGLPPGQSMQRRIDLGNPAILDYPADDTDDSATDFVLAPPTPKNNAGTTRTTPGYASTPAPPGPIAFGSIVVGSTLPASITVRETGGAQLKVSSYSLTGTNKADFAVLTTFPLTINNGGASKTVELTCTPKAVGPRAATLTLTTNDPIQPSVTYDLTCTGQAPPPSLDFFKVTPCRAVDTRVSGGPVVAGTSRTFTMAGKCGVPASAKALSLNVTVTGPNAPGHVTLFPSDTSAPSVSTVNYSAWQTRANNAVVGLDGSGRLSVLVGPSGATHVVIDVNGYFE